MTVNLDAFITGKEEKKNITRWSVPLAMLLLLPAARGFAQVAVFDADFHRGFKAQEAGRLLDRKEYEAAYAAARELAETAAGKEEQAMWQARVAVAFGLQADNFERGIALAAAIDDVAYSVQARMELMAARGDFPGLLESFRAVDIDAWPARPMPPNPRYRRARSDARGLAFFERGRAYYETVDGPAAARDLARAEELSSDADLKLAVLTMLEQVQSRLVGDRDKVYEANAKIVELGGGGARYFRGVLAAAAYLREAGRHDEALEVLGRVNWSGFSGTWFVGGLSAIGRTRAAAGRFAEAADAFRAVTEAPAVKSVNAAQRGAAGLELGGALAAGGDAPAARDAYRKLLEREDARDDHRKQAEAALAGLAQ